MLRIFDCFSAVSGIRLSRKTAAEQQGDWRGTAILYEHHTMKHTNTKLLPTGIATTLTGIQSRRGIRYFAGHIPHHAIISQTEQILGAWGPTMRKARVLLGFDANEALADPDDQGWRARTGRGEVILDALAKHGMQGCASSLSLAATIQ